MQAQKLSTSASYVDQSRVDDSDDSDLEDLHHVIEESRRQIRVTESSLNKHRKDIMDAGIYLDSSKYVCLLISSTFHFIYMLTFSDS